MTLLEQWRSEAYNENADRNKLQALWSEYFQEEKEVYKKLLANPDEKVKGSVKELAEKYGLTLLHMVAFLDGINDSLVNPNPIENMEKDTTVTIEIDLEKLYYNMVACRADWLYNLPQWDNLLSEEKRAELYKSQKTSRTVVNAEKKIGRNEPCPCGSGKKYKNCCGRAS